MAGITVRGLAELLNALPSVHGLATRRVRDDVLRVLTAPTGQSVLEWLVDNLPAGVRPEDVAGTANVFLSHTYSTGFCDLVAAAREWAPEGACFYLDVVVENLHIRAPTIPFEELRDAFRARMRAIGHTLLVLDASVLQRSWCLFEMFTTMEAGARLDITAPAPLLAALDSRGLCEVHYETARAREPSDKANIDRLLRESPLDVNQLLVARMQAWTMERFPSEHADGLRATVAAMDAATRAAFESSMAPNRMEK